MKTLLNAMVCTLCLWLSASAFAEQYLSQSDFLAQTLGAQHSAQVLWLSAELRNKLKDDLNYVPQGARLRYWQAEQKRAWILDEIGRDEPITMGFVIEHNQITQLRILEFRESRGYEVRYPRFTEQFSAIHLDNKRSLSQSIDNITGATLSVNAVKKAAKLALYLNEQVELSSQ